jgi:hypothetical protein
MATGSSNLSRPRLIRAIFNGCVLWAGEAVVGLIPLAAYVFAHGFARRGYLNAICGSGALEQWARFADHCLEYPDSPLQEICVLSVVISGLSLLSIGQFSPGRRVSPRTALTYLMQTLAILSLLAGRIFYGLITAHLNDGHDDWAYAALVVALVSSFVLAIQESILGGRIEAVSDSEHP